MTSSAPSQSPFARFSLLRRRSARPPSRIQDQDRTDQDWYIPYNGPYELPKESVRPVRDGWGNLLATDSEVFDRYGIPEGKGRTRAVSNASRSSGTLDPSRKSYTPSHGRFRRSTQPPPPSFINLGAAGGVGESPVSHAPQTPRTPNGAARALSGIFSGSRRAQSAQGEARDRDEEYYQSWYGTLVGTPRTPRRPQTADQPRQEQHPYAYVFPTVTVSPSAPGPLSAPSVSSPPAPPKLHFMPNTAPPATLSPPPRPSVSLARGLKASTSTPNLRSAQQQRSARERWLCAETWCDALLFPRPRFKVKLTQESGGGDVGEKRDMGEKSVVGKKLMKARSVADLSLGGSVSLAGSAKRRGMRLPDVCAPMGSGAEPEDDASVKKPSRPKSFAQDDLALPSPVPSLTRVLEEGDLLVQQRRDWQKQASHSFQNKRTRSLSRTRAKSLAHARPDEEQEKEKMMEFLAARSLLGSQGVKPTVHERLLPPTVLTHLTGTGTGTLTGTGTFSSNSHSHSNSNASSQKPRGHLRNESWSKSAIKLAKSTAGLCGLSVDGSLLSPCDTDGQIDEKRVKDPAGSARASPANRPNIPGGHPGSPTPSSGEGVGIAISTPPPSDDFSHSHAFSHARKHFDREAYKLPDHPYAQSTASAMQYQPATPAPSRHRYHASQSTRRSEYAGPHLSSSAATTPVTATTDMSMRHRLPPQATLQAHTHPYANVQLQEDHGENEEEQALVPHVRVDSTVPLPKKMYAELAPGNVREILPEEIQYSPYAPPERFGSVRSRSNTTGSYGMHAYVATVHNQHRETTLGVGEALSYTLRTRGSRDSGIGTSEDHGMRMQSDFFQRSRRESGGESLPISKTSSQSLSRGRRKPVSYNHNDLPVLHQAASDPPPSNQTVASSPSDRLQPPSFRSAPFTGPFVESADTSGSGSSPALAHSEASSPQISPHSLGNGDDLDRFRDLFYRPEAVDVPSSPTRPSDVSGPEGYSFEVTTQSSRGFSSLTQELNDQLEELTGNVEGGSMASIASRASIISDRHFGGFGGLRSRRPTDISTSSPFVLSEGMGSSPPSPMEAALPLHLPTEQGNQSTLHPTVSIPEDVESSRASSILERSLLEDDTFGIRVLRMGAVEAVTTPPAVAEHHRKSSHLSFLGEGAESEHEGGEEVRSSTQLEPRPGLRPPRTSEMTRSSYMTSDTGTSRMSGLSDFPAPPVVSPAHMSLIQSYFPDTALQQVEDPPEPQELQEAATRTSRNPSWRMTFGGNEDIENISASRI